MGIYERYEKVSAELEAFLAKPRRDQEVGAWCENLAKLQLELMAIGIEVVSILIEKLKVSGNDNSS